MAGLSFLRSRASRAAFIVVLLLVSLATAAVIAMQAQYSASSQRAAAEGVLRDYSALVADEVIRRADVEIGYYGYFALSAELVAQFQKSGSFPPSLSSSIATSTDSRVKHAASLASSYFYFDPAKGALAFEGTSPPDDVMAWLRERLTLLARQHPDGPFQVINSEAGASQTFVAAFARDAKGKSELVGFQVNLAQLSYWFAAALTRQPLVPASLGHGKVTNDFVRVIVRDQRGAQVYRLGSAPMDNLSATKVFGDTYQKMFAGFTAQASIDPQIAQQLVAGGLPASRVRLFQILLLLDAALIVGAIVQLRREMALQKLRDEFVSSVSHELRTPLTQIRMFTETLLLDRVRSPEESRRYLEIIDTEARRLVQLVENVLRFSRVEKNVDSLSLETRELAPLVAETADDFASMVNGSESQIETRLDPGLFARVDPGALRQVLINLLDNAVKYGKKGQQILVSLESRWGTAWLSVEDEGAGVPASERERIFDRFQRLDRDRKSSVAGTGIGLSVVRDLVSRLGGHCFVTDSNLGGAKFVVELPLAFAPAVAKAEEHTGTSR